MFKYGGLEKRPTYQELIKTIEEPKDVITYPNRVALGIVNSPYFNFFGEETFVELEQQNEKKNINEQIQMALTEIESKAGQTAGIGRGTTPKQGAGTVPISAQTTNRPTQQPAGKGSISNTVDESLKLFTSYQPPKFIPSKTSYFDSPELFENPSEFKAYDTYQPPEFLPSQSEKTSYYNSAELFEETRGRKIKRPLSESSESSERSTGKPIDYEDDIDFLMNMELQSFVNPTAQIGVHTDTAIKNAGLQPQEKAKPKPSPKKQRTEVEETPDTGGASSSTATPQPQEKAKPKAKAKQLQESKSRPKLVTKKDYLSPSALKALGKQGMRNYMADLNISYEVRDTVDMLKAIYTEWLKEQ